MIKIGYNQFLFTKTEPAEIEYDCKLNLSEYNVYLGFGCRAVRAEENGRELIILGFITDTLTGRLSESALALKLLKELKCDGDNIAECFSGVGGRFVCFAKLSGRIFIWSDACALKQMFYDVDTFAGNICAASQARYIAMLKGYKTDAEAEDYIKKAKEQPEFSMPLSASMYKNISRLLPNHFLIDDGNPQRRMKAYNKNYSAISENKRIEMIAGILNNGSESAFRIFNLTVSLTGGLDSRLALTALSREKSSLDVITLKYINMQENHSDLTVPSRFCERFGYNHRIIPCKEPSAEFVSRYLEHSENPHKYWIQMSEAVKKESYIGNALVKGSCSEIVQCPNGVLPDKKVTPKLLCKLFEITQTDFSLRIVGEWLASARSYAKSINIPVLSLFYWEHRMGSWLAECLNEGDVSTEVFSPFNVREALSLMLSFPKEKRIPPDFCLFMEILEKSEPGSSDIEINPGRYSSAASKIKLAIKYKIPFLYKIAIMMSGRM